MFKKFHDVTFLFFSFAFILGSFGCTSAASQNYQNPIFTPASHLKYFEKDSYCYVESYGRIHFWLYDTYTCYDGNGRPLIDAFVLYAERLGWTVDVNNVLYISPNEGLAQSVKQMMVENTSDVSMTIIESNTNSALLYLNAYTKRGGYWFTYIYPLFKY